MTAPVPPTRPSTEAAVPMPFFDDLLSSALDAVLSADLGQLLEVVATEDQFDFYDGDGTRHHFIKGGFDDGRVPIATGRGRKARGA